LAFSRREQGLEKVSRSFC